MIDPRLEIVGIDVGGTFIDYVGLRAGEPMRVHKQLHRPGALADSIREGLTELASGGVINVVHGTTVATNAVLERRGVRTALVTTRGFADLLEIGRQDRPQLYSLHQSRPTELVPRDLRFEVAERVSAEGEVLVSPVPDDLRALARLVRARGVQAAAVCFLFSFRHPEHEALVASALKAEGIDFVCTSVEVLPEYREYERTAVTVANAYVSPLIADYVGEVHRQLKTSFGVERFEIMQSNGGTLEADDAQSMGARLLLSGPAGGVAGAFALGQAHGLNLLITFDMGGTSTDVALCEGSIPKTGERVIAGVPVPLTMVDIETVGAGGGSIARLDSGGALQVGPDSAGADPGPACFGRGTVPTVTDAQAVCGLLDVESFLGGRLDLDTRRSFEAIAPLAHAMGLSIEAAAHGILQVANAQMERAVRRISLERGFDPRDFTLVAFGGAGPLHACAIAEGLGIVKIIVPEFAGVFSALGMATSDTIRDFSQTVLGAEAGLAGVWRDLETRARAALPECELTHTLDCRYAGQGYELEIAASPLDTLVDRFHTAHLARYGYEDRARGVIMVTARLRARQRRGVPPVRRSVAGIPTPARFGQIWTNGEHSPALVVARNELTSNREIHGMALIVQAESATYVAPGWRAQDLGDGTLMMQRGS